ncbi:MAG: YdgA family protein [Azoarcus sp.]|jgi:uncharacterized protein YdgA (DUF945 family)|nr:YdgA family protein [Azoarcus sp.]
MKVGTMEKIVGATALTAVVVCGGSYWVGSQVEQEFRESVDWVSRQGVMVSVVDYQRGVFGATARTDVVFEASSDEDASNTESITVPVVHSIRHGPLSALAAAARIHSEVQLAQLTEDSIAQLNEIFDGDLFFPVLDTVVGWAGGLRLQLALPKADKFHFWKKRDNGEVRGIELENVHASVDVSMKDGLLSTGMVTFDADRIIVKGEVNETIESPSLTFLLENIDIQIIDDPWQAIADILGEQEKKTQEKTATSWLQRKPAFTIKEAHARWPEGMVAGSFRVAHAGDANPDTDTPLGNISGDLQMVLPRALAIRHMSLQVSEDIADTLEGGEENEVNIEKETKEQVDKQMAGLLKDGIFVEKGDTLSVDAHLLNGELNLNGEKRPVGILLELIPPFF